ncbi:MAG TPA: hypothetical protein VN893_15845 [Bryobacteraceae bacterium]|nr:hypothetical protein [Bryobacteraceae bacterium]
MVLAVCLWAFVWVGPYVLRGRASVVTGIELLSCALFVALFWIDRRSGYWKVLFCVFFIAFAIPHFLHGDIISMAQGGLCLLIGYWWFRYGKDPGTASLKVTSVKAVDLTGIAEYDARTLAGVCVEECSEDWTQQFSQVKTDAEGRFALPSREGAVHYVRVSRPEAGTVHLRVELTPEARPLRVRLKRRRISLLD